MQDRPAGALPNLPGARRERGIDGAGRRWLFAGRVPTAGQDQRPGAVLGSACPPRLENGCGESTARFAELDRSTSGNRSGGGGTEISGPASAGCRTRTSDQYNRCFPSRAANDANRQHDNEEVSPLMSPRFSLAIILGTSNT